MGEEKRYEDGINMKKFRFESKHAWLIAFVVVAVVFVVIAI